ncbi:17502_t:CDS:1 [Cetraspora pellucida]|uniref:ATP-dependent DNA helicase n=1 Tax=Cetraspora pellucida TaxID=1433469 RepID=A0A9N9I539_9GLOM|nr:17502_t:CDS:1 [Cetraspora pellucida]
MNSPAIEWDKMKENNDTMVRVVQYLNSLVTTINPRIDAPVPDSHSCQKRDDELQDDLQDYIELINKLQCHTRCSSSYCLRINRAGEQYCRFGYPKEIVEHTFIHDDDHGHPELITVRNDPYINPHDRLQLQGWRANVDLKPVLSTHAALQYISKYASKSEPRSEAFSEILNRILCNSNSNDSSLASFQRLLLHTVAEHDISAQETCHLLLGIPLYHSSRQFVSLNLNKDAPRVLCGAGNENEFLINDNIGKTVKSSLQKYWDRPNELEDVSLYQLYLKYKFFNGRWSKCKSENIIRIWPRPSPQHNDPQWEEFCRLKVLLHVCHRSLEQLIINNTTAWSDLFEHYISEINNDPVNLLGPLIYNIEDEFSDEEDEQQEDSEYENEIRSEWMLLSEMGPNTIIDNYSDLGSRAIDKNHDWVGDTRRRHPNLNIEDVLTSLQRVRNEETMDFENITTDILDFRTLNEKQMEIFKRIEAHYIAATVDHNNVEPLRIIIMGTAGTGKSYLIKAVVVRLNELAKDHGVEKKSPVLLLAPTGVAAYNIHGTTIHSALSIPVNCTNFDLNGERLKQLQNKLQDVKYFIIDEKSMVGHRTLALIDMRLRQAFSEQRDQPFGNQSVILIGDFGQLPPVLDDPIYTSTLRRDSLSNNGIIAYKQFLEVYKLDVVQRQSGNSEDQCHFRNILLRLRDGESTMDDWKTLTTRLANSPGVDNSEFLDATHILPWKTDVNEVNFNKLRALNCPVARINAHHAMGSREASKADSNTAKGLEPYLLLARNARIMLRANLWTEAGLVNGSMGVIQEILFEKDKAPPCLPSVLLVEFEDYSGPPIITIENKRLVPIIPIQQIWESKNVTCSRLQLSICLAWAITVHKSQGLTLAKSKIDLGEREYAAGLSFVAVSRVCTLKDLLFRPFSLERLQRIKKSKRLQERKAEEERLFSLIK